MKQRCTGCNENTIGVVVHRRSVIQSQRASLLFVTANGHRLQFSDITLWVGGGQHNGSPLMRHGWTCTAQRMTLNGRK